MNRSEVRSLVEEATRRTDKTSLINQAINIALKELSSTRGWLDLVLEADLPIVANDLSVTLPADFNRLVEVRLIITGSPLTSRKLFVRPKLWVINRYPNIPDISSGKPVYGYLEGTRLMLTPKSDGSYLIRLTYHRLHPDLTGDADQVLIRHAGQAIAAYATFWTFLSIEKAQDAQNWLGTYQTLLKTAIKVDSDNSAIEYIGDQRGEEVPPIPEYWLDPFVMRNP